MIAIPPFIIGGIAFCNNNSEKEYTNVSFLEKQLLPENTATDGTKSPILSTKTDRHELLPTSVCFLVKLTC